MNTFDRQPMFTLPPDLLREMRSSHAGELGAVWIYRGILAVTRDAEVRAFAEHHLGAEQVHLSFFEQHLPEPLQTRLALLWRPAGWLLGALPALWGPSAVYRTVAAVETFVDRHYAEQIEMLGDQPAHRWLRDQLVEFRADECVHRDDAAGRTAAGQSGLWVRIVGAGSAMGAAVARRC